jgi:hypothetical protein
MNGKIAFAVDYINVLGLMNVRSRVGMNPISHAAILLFLTEWGLSAAELDEANQIFWTQVEQKTLDEFSVAAQRLTKAIAQRDTERKRMMVQLAAIAELDRDLTPDELAYFKSWGETLDLRPSEVGTLFERGKQMAMALSFFGKKFMETTLNPPPHMANAAQTVPTAAMGTPPDAAIPAEDAAVPAPDPQSPGDDGAGKATE